MGKSKRKRNFKIVELPVDLAKQGTLTPAFVRTLPSVQPAISGKPGKDTYMPSRRMLRDTPFGRPLPQDIRKRPGLSQEEYDLFKREVLSRVEIAIGKAEDAVERQTHKPPTAHISEIKRLPLFKAMTRITKQMLKERFGDHIPSLKEKMDYLSSEDAKQEAVKRLAGMVCPLVGQKALRREWFRLAKERKKRMLGQITARQ
ncbi:hypothetical protein HY546_02065 [archaeon]|nr:hypothetical protein [archaeon]